MSTLVKYDSYEKSEIIGAVEILAGLADLEIDKEGVFSKDYNIVIEGHKVIPRHIHWLQDQDINHTIHMVKDAFRVVLHYFHKIYQKEHYLFNTNSIEGIKMIMVLVGEAAKKLDKYTHFFNKTKESITHFREYKKIQEFYQTRIDRKIDENVLGKWILGLASRQSALPELSYLEKKDEEWQELQTKHMFVDLDAVKKDSEYELFFLRREDGSRFFNPRLMRSIKLVCGFESNLTQEKELDPLFDVKLWREHVTQASAQDILKESREPINRFYKEALRYKDSKDLVLDLNKTLLALYMSANRENLPNGKIRKTCSNYFLDFQLFLRDVLNSYDYQKLIVYTSEKKHPITKCLLDLINTLCKNFFKTQGYLSISSHIAELFHSNAHNDVAQEYRDKRLSIGQLLSEDYSMLSQLLKRHPNGPLNKVLELLEENTLHAFDPILQGNLPQLLYDVYYNDHRCNHIRLPSVTHQEFIDKIKIVDEFKAYLRSHDSNNPPLKHLIFNLQDRTSWREHCRCSIIEGLQNHHDFKDSLIVVTLPTNTDFYYQNAPYDTVNQADIFIKQLKEHISDESSGFYFPKSLQDELFPDLLDQMLKGIHSCFFENKNVLGKQQRLDFIEILYLFLELKIIEIVQPDSFTLSCKDSVDIGAAASAKFYTFLKLMVQGFMDDADIAHLRLMIYCPSLLIRERLMLNDRFQRMLGAIKTIEASINHAKSHNDFLNNFEMHFNGLFKLPLNQLKVMTPK